MTVSWFRLPWVSRWHLDAAERERDAAEERLAAAEQRAREAEQRSVAVMAEARLAMADAIALARSAAFVVSPGYEAPAIENPPSVGEADRQAAQRARVRAEERARR